MSIVHNTKTSTHTAMYIYNSTLKRKSLTSWAGHSAFCCSTSSGICMKRDRQCMMESGITVWTYGVSQYECITVWMYHSIKCQGSHWHFSESLPLAVAEISVDGWKMESLPWRRGHRSFYESFLVALQLSLLPLVSVIFREGRGRDEWRGGEGEGWVWLCEVCILFWSTSFFRCFIIFCRSSDAKSTTFSSPGRRSGGRGVDRKVTPLLIESIAWSCTEKAVPWVSAGREVWRNVTPCCIAAIVASRAEDWTHNTWWGK